MAALLLHAAAGPAAAESARNLVQEGNRAYREGRFPEALSRYEAAAEARPESAAVDFNRAATLYRQGDFDRAAELFERAASRARDAELAAAGCFNQGNCAYRRGMGVRQTDPQRAVADLEESVRLYREALIRKPDFRPAAENIEVARRRIRSIREEIQRREKISRERQADRAAARERVEELIRRQEKLTGPAPQGEESPEDADGSMSAPAEAQRRLSTETGDLAAELAEKAAGSSGPMKAVPESLERAKDHQSAAADELEKHRAGPARQRQQDALRALEEARRALADQRGEDQEAGQAASRQSGPSPPPAQGGTRPPAAAVDDGAAPADRPAGEPENPSEGAEERPGLQLADDARAILDEEKGNRRRRVQPETGGFREVERDW